MTDEQRQLLLDTRLDVDRWPSSPPRRQRGMRMRNSSHKKIRSQRTSSTERRAIKRVYSTQSEGW